MEILLVFGLLYATVSKVVSMRVFSRLPLNGRGHPSRVFAGYTGFVVEPSSNPQRMVCFDPSGRIATLNLMKHQWVAETMSPNCNRAAVES
jgi:hypothetical protein